MYDVPLEVNESIDNQYHQNNLNLNSNLKQHGYVSNRLILLFPFYVLYQLII